MASLDSIIESILEPEDSAANSGQSLIVHTHLAQMKMFGIRQGVELYPLQDDNYGSRKKFIDNNWRVNKLDLYLDRQWDLLVCQGQILLYARPTKDGPYNIYFYKKDQFKPYYDRDCNLIKVVVIYSFKEETNFDGIETIKWVRLVITSDEIIQTESEAQPSFNDRLNTFTPNTVRLRNTLGFIPCVVVRNNNVSPGQDGISDFHLLRAQIEKHESLSQGISDNLEFFGSPTLVATRTNHELTEAVENGTENLNRHRTLTSAAGWTGAHQSSQRYTGVSSRPLIGRQVTVKKIIGNVQPDERFGYISPDPISPDHSLYFRQNREELHYALGGIDELGLTSNATAYEMKTVYGKVATTALKKAEAIYTHGLCELFEMLLAAEENLFRKTLAIALKKDESKVTDGFIQDLLSKGKIPPGVYGLPPLGSRTINWRWKGPVFEESADDQQRKSIVCRNMQELGVRSLEALKFFFDNKTEKELEGMLSGGVGFRYFGAIASSLSQTINLYQQMLSVPTPGRPDIPMAFGVDSPVLPIIQRLMEVLFTEINYGQQFDPVAPGDPPNYNTNYTQLPLSRGDSSGGSPTDLLSTSNSVPPGISPAGATGLIPSNLQGFGGFGFQQPVGGIFPQASLAPEFTSGVPEPGAIVGNPPASTPAEQRLPIPTGIPADLAVSAAQPGSIWQQLFPTFSKLRSRKK